MLRAFPGWFRELPHLFVAVCLLLLLLAVWLCTRDHDVFQMLTTVFGAVMGFLTGRAVGTGEPK